MAALSKELGPRAKMVEKLSSRIEETHKLWSDPATKHFMDAIELDYAAIHNRDAMEKVAE